MTCILSCRTPGPRAETATKSQYAINLHVQSSNPRHHRHAFSKPRSLGIWPIRKGILHTWLRSRLVGLGGPESSSTPPGSI